MRYQLHIIPESYPTVIRPCAKCGALKPFSPANEIRINAQKKLLDVWLIHRCDACGQTWNLEIFARIVPGKLDRALYDRLLSNDADLVREFAFDAGLHARKGVALCHDGLQYRIEGQRPEPAALTERAEMYIRCDVPLGIKISKLLREILGLSAKRLDALIDAGAITALDGLNLAKAKMGTSCTIAIDPADRAVLY